VHLRKRKAINMTDTTAARLLITAAAVVLALIIVAVAGHGGGRVASRARDLERRWGGSTDSSTARRANAFLLTADRRVARRSGRIPSGRIDTDARRAGIRWSLRGASPRSLQSALRLLRDDRRGMVAENRSRTRSCSLFWVAVSGSL